MLELDVSAPSSVSVYFPFATSLSLEPPLSVPPQLVTTPTIPIRKTQLRPARIQLPCLRTPSSSNPASAMSELMGISRREMGALCATNGFVLALAKNRTPFLIDPELHALFTV